MNPRPPWSLLLGSILLLAGCASLPRPEGPPGPSARASQLLDAHPAERLLIEVDRTASTHPRPRALARFMERTAHYLDKPGGIELVVDVALPDEEWPDQSKEIRRLASRHRSVFPTDARTTAIHVLYGPRWKRFRGYTWPRRAMTALRAEDDAPLLVLFQEPLKPILWITGVRQEASVLIHELGHALGLATDPGHSFKGHCTNAWCLMYDGVDARTLGLYFLPTLLGGYLPLDFCQDCQDDLYPEHAGQPPGQRSSE